MYKIYLANTDVMWVVLVIALIVLVVFILIVLIMDAVKSKKSPLSSEEKKPIINIYVDEQGKITAPENVNIVYSKKEITAGRQNEVPKSDIKKGNIYILKIDRKDFQIELAESKSMIKQKYSDLLALFKTLDAAITISESKIQTLIKLGPFKLCELRFARGNLKALFYVGTGSFKAFSKDEGNVPLLEKPTVVDLGSEQSLSICNKLAELTYKQVSEARNLSTNYKERSTGN